MRVVRYGAMGWVGEFNCKSAAVVPWGAKVVIQTERGIELGEYAGPACEACTGEEFVKQVRCYVQSCGPDFCRPRSGRILRIATEQDLNEQKHLNAHVHEDIEHCADLAYQFDLDLKVVTAEHLLGGERIVFYFRSPARVDFRQLVKELAQQYRTRIEMRQVGARDEARLVADYEICGRECCCRNFLKKLRPVNMKMAKLQKSTLDPSKVSGRCGRLRCCLRYEHVGYEELASRLPRAGTRVGTDFGPVTVIDRQILTQLVAARTDDDRLVTIPLEEIRAFNLPPAPPKPPPAATAVGGEAVRSDRPSMGSRSRRDRPERAAPGKAPGSPRVETPTPTGAPKEIARAESRFRPEPPLPAEAAAGDVPKQPPPAEPSARPVPEAADAKEGRTSRRRRRRRRKSHRGDSSASPPDAGPGN